MMTDFFANNGVSSKGLGEEKWDVALYEALLNGGEQLEDMNMHEASEEVVVQLAAHGVIGKKVDQMETGFMTASVIG
ncbi:hypothetical protein C2S52_016052 [Perilla frutescens var. hirtella]|nr:hypothetical protein C2S52_016052 [Perilla frutescens var. hirtella]